MTPLKSNVYWNADAAMLYILDSHGATSKLNVLSRGSSDVRQ